MNEGSNLGLSGMLACPALGLPGTNSTPTWLIAVDVAGFRDGLGGGSWQAQLAAPDHHEVTGPGSQFNKQWYGGNSGGEGVATGAVRSDFAPYPATFHNVQGTLTLTHNGTTNQLAFPVLLGSVTVSKETQTTTGWKLQATWKKNGAFVTSAWSQTNNSYTPVTLTSHEIFAGTAKGKDGQLLEEPASTHHVLALTAAGTNATYSDISIAAAVDAYLGTLTPPRPEQKLVTADFSPIDDAAGWLTVQWGLVDNKDAIQNPANQNTVDSNQILDVRTLRSVYDSSGNAPVTPTPPVGLKLLTYLDQVHTDGRSSRHWIFRRTNSADEVQNPNRSESIDPNDLDTQFKTGTIFNSTSNTFSEAPTTGTLTGMRIVAYQDTTVNDVVKMRTVIQGKADSKDEIELRHLWHGSKTVLDPNSLNTYGQVTKLDVASPTIPTGTIARDLTVRNHTFDHKVYMQAFGLRSTIDDETMPRTSSTRSAFRPYRDMVAAIINSSATDANEANTQWASLQTAAFIDGISITSHTPNKKILVAEYLNTGLQVNGVTTGRSRRLPAMVRSGNVQVFITKRQIDSLTYRCVHRMVDVYNAPVRHFFLMRNITAATVPDQNPATINGVTLPAIGTVNNATFMGLAAGTCLFIGSEFDGNLALSANWLMRYEFISDAVGIFNYFGPMGQEFITRAAVTQGWNDASILTAHEVDIEVPAQASFAAFLNYPP